MKRCVLLLLLATALTGFAAPRPNILYLYVDDMGWGSIGPNGQASRKAQGQPYVMTPHLDQLAADGVNFSRGYGATVCSPARSSQQSGFHQGHTFADRNDPNNAKKAMRADDVLMGDALAKAGYVTGYWGKWGYGGSKDPVNPTIDNVQTLPTSHGYKYVVAELHHVRAHTFFQPTLWNAPAASGAIGGIELQPNSMKRFVGKKTYPDEPALQNHPNYPKTAYCDDVYAFAALDFVRAQAKNYKATGQPFFGLLAVQVPHSPFGDIENLPEWDRAYKDHPHFAGLGKQSKQWAAMVTRIDAHFGHILAALEDPNGDGDDADSVAENTLVVFQSDNGGPGQLSNKEFDANGGLRGNKGSIFEGGIRVPTMMRWPSKITASSRLKKGTTTDMVMGVTDLLPTFCDLAGVPAPLGIDGVSLAPTLLSEGHQRKREFLIHEAGSGSSIIRGKHKLILSKKGVALYDLEADHGEEQDLSGKNKKLVKELRTLLVDERVTEPRGFANTYHRWTGTGTAKASDPKNWSDYVYENAGVTYMTDAGAPRVSWVATMANDGTEVGFATVDEDLAFLGLEIRGGRSRQSLIMKPGVNLVGRNEIRIAKGGDLSVTRGTLTSLRWVEVMPGGSLLGTGEVDAHLYNGGLVRVGRSKLVVAKDYRESAGAQLAFVVGEGRQSELAVEGHAALAGTLQVTVGDEVSPGTAFTILTADAIEGTFADVEGKVTVTYAKKKVVVTVK